MSKEKEYTITESQLRDLIALKSQRLAKIEKDALSMPSLMKEKMGKELEQLKDLLNSK